MSIFVSDLVVYKTRRAGRDTATTEGKLVWPFSFTIKGNDQKRVTETWPVFYNCFWIAGKKRRTDINDVGGGNGGYTSELHCVHFISKLPLFSRNLKTLTLTCAEVRPPFSHWHDISRICSWRHDSFDLEATATENGAKCVSAFPTKERKSRLHNYKTG